MYEKSEMQAAAKRTKELEVWRVAAARPSPVCANMCLYVNVHVRACVRVVRATDLGFRVIARDAGGSEENQRARSMGSDCSST